MSLGGREPPLWPQFNLDRKWALNDKYGRGLRPGFEMTLWSFLCREPLPENRAMESLSTWIDWTHPMGPVLYDEVIGQGRHVVAAWMGEKTLILRPIHVMNPPRPRVHADEVQNLLIRLLKDQTLESRPSAYYHEHEGCLDYCDACLEPERFAFMTKGI